MLLFCVHKKYVCGSGKLKFLVFEIPRYKNKKRTTLPSSPFREITKNYEKKNEKQIAILYYLWI